MKKGIDNNVRGSRSKDKVGRGVKIGSVKGTEYDGMVIICQNCGEELTCDNKVEYFRYLCPVCKKGRLVRKS